MDLKKIIDDAKARARRFSDAKGAGSALAEDSETQLTVKVMWGWSGGNPCLVFFDDDNLATKEIELAHPEAQLLIDAGVDHGS